MTLPARRRGRIFLTLTVAAAALLGSLAVVAQQPASPPAGSTATPAATPAKKAAAKAEPAAATDPRSAQSYSLGLQWGESLRNSGLTPELINTAKIAQGMLRPSSMASTPTEIAWIRTLLAAQNV